MSDEQSNDAVELTRGLKIPTRVWWKTLDGQRHEGTLVDWDNGTAIIMRSDTGTVVAVRTD